MLIAEVARVGSRIATDYLTVFQFLKRNSAGQLLGEEQGVQGQAVLVDGTPPLSLYGKSGSDFGSGATYKMPLQRPSVRGRLDG